MQNVLKYFIAALLLAVAGSAAAQLTVTKTATDTAGNPISAAMILPSGSTINYRVAFKYPGAQYIPGAHLIDQMSAGQQYIAGSLVTPNGWTAAAGASIFNAANKADFLTQPIFPNGSIGVVIQANSGITSAVANAGTSGDGLIPILDPADRQIFYVHHHTMATIGCIDMSTGTKCAGYASELPVLTKTTSGGTQINTNGNGDQFYYNGRIYFAAWGFPIALGSAESGLGCWDVATAASCPFIQNPGSQHAANFFNFSARRVGTGPTVYMNDNGKISCFTVPLGASCAGFIAPGFLFSSAELVTLGSNSASVAMDVYQGRYLIWTGSTGDPTANGGTGSYTARAQCYDLTTNSICAGAWPVNYATNITQAAAIAIYDQPVQAGRSGTEPGFCLVGRSASSNVRPAQPYCYTLAGATLTNAFTTAYFNADPGVAFFGGPTTVSQDVVSHNLLQTPNTAQVIYPMIGSAYTRGAAFCFDFGLNTPCPAFHDSTHSSATGISEWSFAAQNGHAAVGTTSDYGYTYFEGCAYGLGDAGKLWSFDPATGNTPCLSGAGAITQAVPAQQYCDGKQHVTGWQTLTVNGLGNGIYNTTIQVVDANTNAVLIPLTFYPISGDTVTVDLSGISYTLHPSLSFAFLLAGPAVAANTPLADAVVSFTTDRTDQDICYSAKAPAACGLSSAFSNTASFNDLASNPISGTVATAGICATPTVSIVKSANITTYNPGQSTPLTYQLLVKNVSNVDAANVAVSDPAPSGVNINSWSCAGCTPASGSGTVSTSIGTIAPNVTVPITVTATITPTASGVVPNTATVTPPTGGDCTTIPCSSTVSTPPGASLAILKTVDKTTYSEGTATGLNYSLLVVNNSPTAATGVTLSDIAPAGLTITGWACGGCSPSSGTGNVATTFNVAGNGNITIAVSATIAAATKGAVINTASITPPANTFCAGPGSCTSSAETDPLPRVSVVKTASIQNYQPGQNTALTYTLTVSNSATVAASGVQVTDNAPMGVTIGAWTAPGCAPSSGTGNVSTSCNVAASSSTAISVAATIDTGATGALTNTATITPPPGTQCQAPSPACTSTVTTPPAPVLSIAKTASTPTYVEGAATAITYTVIISNSTATAVLAATVSDAAPAGVTVTSWNAPGCSPASGSGSVATACNVPGNGTVTLTVNGTIRAGTTGTVTNTATVTPPTGSFCASAGGCTSTVNTTPVPKVSIVKTSSVPNYIPGNTTPLTYTLTVANTASVAATGVVVADTAPAHMTFGAWNAPGCAPGSGSGNVATTCNVPATDTVAITVAATIDGTASGTVANNGTITPPPGGQCVAPSPGCSSTVNTPAGAVLSILKTASIGNYVEGTSSTLDYTLTVSNASTSPATNVQVADAQPANVSFLSWSAPGCTPAAGVGAVMTACSLAGSASMPIVVHAVIATASTGSSINTATITPNAGDSCQSNTSCTSSVTIPPLPRLSLVKTESRNRFFANTVTPITYTLVVSNASSVDAIAIPVSDPVPTDVAFLSWSAPGCTPATGTGAVTTQCNIPALSAATIVVTASLLQTAHGVVTNSATVAPYPKAVCDSVGSCVSSVSASPSVPPVVSDPPTPIPVLSWFGVLLLASLLVAVRMLHPAARARQ